MTMSPEATPPAPAANAPYTQAPYAQGAIAQPRSPKLGFVAMLLGIGVFVLSLAASALMGVAAAPYAVSGPQGISVMLNAGTGDPVETTLTILALLHVLLGTAIGVWALVQGIVAIATKRGRAFGVVALVTAFLAPGISLIVYFGTALALAP